MWIQFANLIQTGLLLEHKAPFACEIHSLGTVFIEARDLNIQECVDIIPVSMYPRLSEVLWCPPANPSAVDHRLLSSQARVVFFLTLICVCACVCACTRMWYGSQGTACGDQLSPLTMRIPRNELGLSSLVSSVYPLSYLAGLRRVFMKWSLTDPG